MNRRSFLRGLGGAGLVAFAAPAIVRASSLMAAPRYVHSGIFFNGLEIFFDREEDAILAARIVDATNITIQTFSETLYSSIVGDGVAELVA